MDDPAREDIEVEGPLPPAPVWLLGGILFLMVMLKLYAARDWLHWARRTVVSEADLISAAPPVPAASWLRRALTG